MHVGRDRLRVAVIVAHPDDETLWAGGTLLMHPRWDCFVAALCRGSDADRAPKFRRALAALGARGAIADLDDGPEQAPLPPGAAEEAVLSLLPRADFDLLITHGPAGEYTRHRRHEEANRAVLSLWRGGGLTAQRVWLFAYDDAGGRALPQARDDADVRAELPDDVFAGKYAIVTGIYGFAPDSWEARTTPRREAFRLLEPPGPRREDIEDLMP